MKVTGVVLDSNFANEVKRTISKQTWKEHLYLKRQKFTKQEQINMIHI